VLGRKALPDRRSQPNVKCYHRHDSSRLPQASGPGKHVDSASGAAAHLTCGRA
jgi:hypothetical protein